MLGHDMLIGYSTNVLARKLFPMPAVVQINVVKLGECCGECIPVNREDLVWYTLGKLS
ncbi:Hypothetical protein I595_1150 [Croceitalea dokdonensis DOKDO 023]|uniref:Uncharacterized protein n=1 Tax=Croceitalea dokdonensis DOKDO 023 TaxID=1300341 RepID=A0A0N8H492_9FLAO|nr:Hypothetical protein I595_1150 [Croceitalea dokdonensis DOKDO 023]